MKREIDRKYGDPRVGCLVSALSLGCFVGALVAAYDGRWWFAGGAVVVAVVPWFFVGPVDPRHYDEAAEKYDLGGDRDG